MAYQYRRLIQFFKNNSSYSHSSINVNHSNRSDPKMLSSTTSHHKKKRKEKVKNKQLLTIARYNEHFGRFSANSLNRGFRCNEPSI